MKIKVKTLTGAGTDYEVEPTDTVLSLKEKVAAEHGADVSAVRLAFSGRVLNNADTLEASRVKEGDTLIAVIPRSKPAAKPAPQVVRQPEPAPQPQPQPQPQAQPEPKPEPQPQPAVQPEPAAPAQPEQPQPSVKVEEPQDDAPIPAMSQPQPGVSQPVVSQPQHQELPIDEEQISKLVAMGFPRDECVRALRLAYNNPDRAVQFLLEGFPEAGDDDDDDGLEGGDGTEITSAQIFQRLTAEPQFQQLRAAVQANPMLLQPLMNQLKESNPLVYNVIMDNREQFSQWLSQSGAGGAAPSIPIPSGDGPAIPAPSAGAAQPMPRPQAPAGPRLELTAEDRSAIQQLVEMGFSESDSVNAYFACEKNLQLAANFLMENGGFGF